jgi:hypothetical protein
MGHDYELNASRNVRRQSLRTIDALAVIIGQLNGRNLANSSDSSEYSEDRGRDP